MLKIVTTSKSTVTAGSNHTGDNILLTMMKIIVITKIKDQVLFFLLHTF